MGEAAKVLARLSFEEYLALEEKAPLKHELVDGVMYAMAGASDRHNGVVMNLAARLLQAARGKGCRVYASVQAYLRVDSRARRVEGYYRQGEQWLYTDALGMGEVSVPCPPLRLSLDEIYEGLDVPDRLPEDPDA